MLCGYGTNQKVIMIDWNLGNNAVGNLFYFFLFSHKIKAMERTSFYGKGSREVERWLAHSCLVSLWQWRLLSRAHCSKASAASKLHFYIFLSLFLGAGHLFWSSSKTPWSLFLMCVTKCRKSTFRSFSNSISNYTISKCY